MKNRLLSFANSTIAITYSGSRPTDIITFLYEHLPHKVQGNKPHLTYRLIFDTTDNTLRLYKDDTLIQRNQSKTVLAEYLLGQSCYDLADKSQNGLLLHAAGLAWQGQGLILPGQTGAGKSTLSSYLLTQGFQYASDELIFVPQQSTNFYGFTRPLNLKHTARPILQSLIDFETHQNQIWTCPHIDLIPPKLLSPSNLLKQSPLNVILFPHYHADNTLELQKLSKAQAGLALMQCLLNARNLSNHGFPEITRLVQKVPAYQLNYSNFAQVAQIIKSLLS